MQVLLFPFFVSLSVILIMINYSKKKGVIFLNSDFEKEIENKKKEDETRKLEEEKRENEEKEDRIQEEKREDQEERNGENDSKNQFNDNDNNNNNENVIDEDIQNNQEEINESETKIENYIGNGKDLIIIESQSLCWSDVSDDFFENDSDRSEYKYEQNNRTGSEGENTPP